MNTDKILDAARFAQVGFVVNNIEETKHKFAMLFGCEPPETQSGGTYDITQTTIGGVPAPEAGCKLAFFNLSSGVQLELIEPNGCPSTWKEFLDTQGEGIHHIAFVVNDTDLAIKQLREKFDAVVEQQGNYGDGTGRYTYLSTFKTLKCRIELLESFQNKEGTV